MKIRIETGFEELGFGFEVAVKGHLLDADGPKWLLESISRKEYFRYDNVSEAASWIQEAEEKIVATLKERYNKYQEYLSFRDRYSLVKEVIL